VGKENIYKDLSILQLDIIDTRLLILVFLLPNYFYYSPGGVLMSGMGLWIGESVKETHSDKSNEVDRGL